MTFGSSTFAFFFAAVFLLHWVLPRRSDVQNAVLLLASWAFYVALKVKLLPVLIVSTLIDFMLGLALGPEHQSPTRRRFIVGASLTFNVLLLGWFKYVGFLTASANDLLQTLGFSTSLPVLRVLLPIGISYYTLMKVGYILDVYYRRIEPCRSLLAFSVFSGFFAQILAGPVGRATHLLPQYSQPRRLEPRALSSAAGTFLVGFMLQAFVANTLAELYVGPILSNHQDYGVAGHWWGLFSYCLQLFADFAGYSLMAIGVGRAFGIELPVNFDYPFFSRGMLEFWRRWHISLNNWLFDYLYSPLTTGSSWFRGRLATSFLVVFLISGIWHGAAWGFVIWGLLHGVGLAIQHRWDQFYKGLCRQDRVWVARRKSGPYQLCAWCLTQLFFLLTLVPFRYEKPGEALQFFRGLFGGAGASPDLDGVRTLLVAAALILFHLAGSRRGQPLLERFKALPHPLRGATYGTLILLLAVLVPKAAGSFIYANF